MLYNGVVKTSFRFVVDRELLAAAHAKAGREGKSLASVIRKLLEEWTEGTIAQAVRDGFKAKTGRSPEIHEQAPLVAEAVKEGLSPEETYRLAQD